MEVLSSNFNNNYVFFYYFYFDFFSFKTKKLLDLKIKSLFKSMKIAIISRTNIKDVSYWSGAIENIYHALKIKNDKLQIIKIDNLNNTLRKIFALKEKFSNTLKMRNLMMHTIILFQKLL